MNHSNMHDCSFIRDHLSAYMDGELSAELTAEVRQHLGSCEACSGELVQFGRLAKLVSTVSNDAVSTDDVTSLPCWDVFAKQLDVSGTARAVVFTTVESENQTPSPVLAQSWKTVAGVMVALAASLLLIASQRQPADDHRAITNQVLNLQPVLELLEHDSNAALDHLTNQFATKDVSLDQVDTGFGRPTFVSFASHARALPGNAQVAATKVMSFPFCKCPEGECSCGPEGCSCIATVCERPDGSRYLVLEHCKSQSVSFGNLPVQLVNRNGRQFQRVTVDGTETISFDRPTGRVTVVGLRGEAEVKSLLASL